MILGHSKPYLTLAEKNKDTKVKKQKYNWYNI